MFIIYFFITLCDIPITFPLYFQRGSTFGQTQHSNVFGSACNALHSIIATIMFALGDGFCWIWANAILLKIDCCQQVLKVCQETEVSVQWNGTEMYRFLFDRKSWKVCLSQTNYPDVEQRSSKAIPPTHVAFCCNLLHFLLHFVAIFLFCLESVVHGFVEKSRSDRFCWIHGFCWIWANAILLKIDCCQQVLKVCQETEVSVQWNGTEMYRFLFDRKSWKVCLSQTNYPDVEQRSSKEHHCSRYFPGELWLFRLWIVILRMRARGGGRRS